MPLLHLTLLGGFEVRLGTGPLVVLARKKAQALLAFLVVEPGEAHLRDKLAALLWADSSDQRARQSLRQTLLALKQALPRTDPELLHISAETVAVNRQAVKVDVAVFAQRVAEGTPEALAQAAALYTGDFLEGLGVQEPRFEEWLVRERERLRELALEALAKLLAHQTRTAAVQPAIHTAGRLLAVDPLQEVVHRALMRLYARQGRRGAALRQYQLCLAVLRRELGVEPEAATKQLYQEILQTQLIPPATPRVSETGENLPANDADEARSDASVPDAPLVGREAEMAALRGLRAEAWRGQARIAVVQGEAGIGKSRLIDAFVADTVEQGGRVLLGRAHETERIFPFGPWVDAFRSAGVVAELARPPGLSAAWREQLARLFPELGSPRAAVEEEGHVRLFEAMAHAVGTFGARQPLLLVLEDLHWADDMSLRLLAFLSRRGAAWPVLLLATVRTEELVDAPAVTRVLRELGSDRHFASSTLAPLSAGDTLTLVRLLARVGTDEPAVQRLGAQIWRASEGNPFMVVEAMRSLDGTDAGERPGELPIPPRVRDIITARLDRLSPHGRDLMALASVIGREFDFALLESAAGTNGPQTATTVEELVAHRVLHVVHEQLDFTHDRIREVAYERLLPPLRRLLHAGVADALEKRYAKDFAPGDSADPDPRIAERPVRAQAADSELRLAEVAHHCFLSLPHGDPRRAARFGLLAGRRAAVALAHEDAATWYTRALHALSGVSDADPAMTLELLLALGDVQARAAGAGDPRPTFEQAAALARTLDQPAALGRAALGLADRGLGISIGPADPVVLERLDEALQRGADTDTVLRARLLARLAADLCLANDRTRTLVLGEQAVEMARRLGDASTLAYALSSRHFVLWRRNDPTDRLPLANQIVEMAEAAGERELAAQGRSWKIIDLMGAGAASALDAEIESYARFARELRHPRHLWLTANFLAMRALWMGRWDEAERHAREAMALGERSADPSALAYPYVQIFVARREQGRLAEDEERAKFSVAQFPTSPVPRTLLALLYCELGRLAAARAELDHLAADDFTDLRRDYRIGVLPYLCEVCNVLGDRSRAALLYELVSPFAGSTLSIASIACLGAATLYLGMLSATLGRAQRALAELEDALERHAAMGAEPLLARTQFECARVLLAHGDKRRASSLLGDAARRAKALEMRALGERIAALRDHGAVHV